jgi:hypothetical protein
MSKLVIDIGPCLKSIQSSVTVLSADRSGPARHCRPSRARFNPGDLTVIGLIRLAQVMPAISPVRMDVAAPDMSGAFRLSLMSSGEECKE